MIPAHRYLALAFAVALAVALVACAAPPSEDANAVSAAVEEPSGLERFYGRWVTRSSDPDVQRVLYGFSVCEGGDIVIERPALWTSWLGVRCADMNRWVGYFQPGNYTDEASIRYEGGLLWLDQRRDDGLPKDIGVYARACAPGADCPTPVPLRRGDVAAGEAAFRPCRACHSLDDNGVGPALRGVFQRRAGTAAGFAYSDAFNDADVFFDEEALGDFLAAPRSVVPNNKMAFPGITDPQQRRDLVAYLIENR